MRKLQLKPKAVKSYYSALEQFRALDITRETAVRDAFQDLLKECGRQFGWTLVPEWPLARAGRVPLRADGALVDEFRLRHGLWEAKDSADDLRREAKKKLELGYPSDNIIFQSPERAILYQNGREVLDADIREAEALVGALEQFFDYRPPAYEQWGEAVEDFKTKIPEFGRALAELIEKERRANKRFREAFGDFYELCRQSVNPNLSEKAVEEMLIQHLLTERIFRTVFNKPDFMQPQRHRAPRSRSVIDALTVAVVQPRRVPASRSTTSTTPSRRRRRHDQGVLGEAGVSQHRLRAVLPGLLGRGGGHARHRLHAAADRRLSWCASVEECCESEFGEVARRRRAYTSSTRSSARAISSSTHAGD